MSKRAKDKTVRISAEELVTVPVAELVPYEHNARTHSDEQVERLRRSLQEFGFVAPILIDEERRVIAGHGRLLAAQAEGMESVPCVRVGSLTEAQRRAYILADNRLAEDAGWDEEALRFELDEIAALDFDVSLTGFDVEPGKPIHVREHDREKAGHKKDAPEHFWGDDGEEPEANEEYDAFVDKFRPKLTTDDCYTPENIYQAIRDWAVKHYDLGDAPILRPFYPGGDYEHENYPEGCVVIDNPPFSILSKICRFYQERNIRYFLFAPALTLFSIAAGSCNYLPIGADITYENGAGINTAFVTNLGGWKIETSPELYATIKAINDANRHEGAAELPGYIYPINVISPATIVKTGMREPLRICPEDVAFTRALDAQKSLKRAIYGGGFLLSEKAAAEKAAAEKAAAEKAAAEKAAAEKAAAHVWELSVREEELVKSLGKH